MRECSTRRGAAPRLEPDQLARAWARERINRTNSNPITCYLSGGYLEDNERSVVTTLYGRNDHHYAEEHTEDPPVSAHKHPAYKTDRCCLFD